MGFSSPRCLFQLEGMYFETSVKNLEAQNAQVQIAILELAKGQQELKALIIKKKKKPKGSVGLSHLTRKVKIPVKRSKKAPIPEIVGEGEGDNHSNQGSAKPSLSSNEEDYHSEDEQGDDKYQQLEERMKAMEIQKIPGLDFKDLGLVSDIFIPPKFKVPIFAKYDGVSCPKLHLRSYVRKIQPHTTDNKLWIHFFQESLSGTQLEWYYQLENTKVHTWEELAAAFYKQYQYNADLAPTRTQLRGMSMGPKESFKGYAQKWRDMAGRVQPPLSDRELVDMFMGTLTGPFYSHLLGSSSSGFTDLILTGERVESGIRNGKIQVGSSSGTTKRPIRNEINTAQIQTSHKSDQHQSVGAVMISVSAPQKDQQPKYTHRPDAPRRTFTKINMPISQALQHLLKADLITLRGPPKNVNTSSLNYRPDATCAYHSNCPGHDADHCWALKNKIQDMIDAGEIEFDPPETPNVITAPMPKHDKTVNAIIDTVYIYDVNEVSIPLLEVKRKFIQAGYFPGCDPDCFYCSRQPNGCENLKMGIQKHMDRRIIMFERLPSMDMLGKVFANGIRMEDVSVISSLPFKISTKAPFKLSATLKVASVVIARPTPFPYSSDKAVPWGYDTNVYIHGVKQDPSTKEDATLTTSAVSNIAGTSKITRSGRIFSPEISPNIAASPIQVPIPIPDNNTRGKEPLIEPVQNPVEITAEDPSKQEMDEILKIICKSDYNIVEQLGHTASKISMLSLLKYSEAHAKALMKFLQAAHVPQEIPIDQFENCVASLTVPNGLGFSDVDLTPAGRNHNKALHISIECNGTTLSHVLIDNGSSLNVLPKVILEKLDFKGVVLQPSDVVVRAFDGSTRTVYGEVKLPIRVGSQTFDVIFSVIDVLPTYSCLLGRPWIHGANAVTSTLHQKLKYPVKGKVVTVYGEEEYMVSHLSNDKYVEMEGESIETPYQAFEVVSPDISTTKHIPATPATTMASLKDAKAMIEQGDRTVWGQLPDIPYKSDKLGLGYNGENQKNDQNPRSEGLISHFASQEVNAIDDEGVFMNHIIQPYPDEIPPISMGMWDAIQEPNGGYNYQYATPQNSYIAMDDLTPTGWGDQIGNDESFTSPVTEQYQNPPKEVWDTLGEPSGKYDYMVKYSAPPSSQIVMEDIVPTGWDEHYDDNFALEKAREIPNNEGCFLSAYTPHQDAQVSIQNIIPTAWDGLIEHLAQPTEISQPGLSYPAEYIPYPEGSPAHFPTNEINAVEDEEDNCNWNS